MTKAAGDRFAHRAQSCPPLSRCVGTSPPFMRPALTLLVFAILLLLPATAHAHAVGLSRGAYVVEDGAVRADLTFARAEVVALVSALDQNSSRPDLEPLRSELGRVVLGGVIVSADGASCAPRLEAVSPTEQDGLEIRGRYECSRGTRNVHVAFRLLDALDRGHRHLVHAVGASVVDDVCFRGHDEFDVAVPGTNVAATERQEPSWLQFLSMGIEHILTGYDHLVFLFGLVLVGGRLKAIVAAITAFTLAHSISLALATLGVWAPSPRIVEPAIALSIAYVGVENLFVNTADKRWRITFLFGLIHGFGFAGALREIGLPRAEIPEALVLFNLGVEAGQLAALAVFLPLLYRLRRYEWFRGRAVRLLSAGVALAGVTWFLVRLR